MFLLAPLSRATTAASLDSFEGVEEPLVKFFPGSGKFERDRFANITDRGGGTFRFSLRYNAEWWDADRDTLNKDRQRAEVKGLGPHQKHGDTFDYSTTWRASPGFRAEAGFCHIFQLKAVNGDSGAPLITLSLHGDTATVEANSTGPKIIAREFPWRPDTWQTVRIRVKTSLTPDGELLVSVDGDALQGKKGIILMRPEADEYRPKWGLYRRAAAHAPLADGFIEHRAITAVNSDVPAIADVMVPHLDRPENALAWAQRQPSDLTRSLALLKIFSRWSDRDPKAALHWLQQHARTPEWDPVLWLFATDTTFRYVNRELALAAPPLIQDSDLRAKAFAHVLEIWSREDAVGARAYLENIPSLSAEQKQEIGQKLRR
jgi:hypothetical protein